MIDFYRQLREELVRDLTMRGWNAADAEDGAQAALLEILARKNNVDHPRAYAYTIANRLLSRAK